jgi:hypothetical protein
MKIERKDYVPMCRFDEIAEGDIFIDAEGDVYMKMEIIQEEDGYRCYNAVILESGEITFFEPSERITLPRSAKLVIE